MTKKQNPLQTKRVPVLHQMNICIVKEFEKLIYSRIEVLQYSSCVVENLGHLFDILRYDFMKITFESTQCTRFLNRQILKHSLRAVILCTDAIRQVSRKAVNLKKKTLSFMRIYFNDLAI